MTVAEILEQARKLTPQEREELARRLLELRESEDQPEQNVPETHWGNSLRQLTDSIGPIEMKYPEIEDPVEWVLHLRAEQRRRRLGMLEESEEGSQP